MFSNNNNNKCILATLLFAVLGANSEELKLSRSCSSLSDGLHYIKPTLDGEIIPVYCDNGYTMLNLALHFDSISSHFTSFYQYNWNLNGIFSTDCEITSDESSWRNWFIPANSDTKFRVSQDCMTCADSLSYGSNVGYYMTNYYFCWNKHHTWECSLGNHNDLLERTDLSYIANDDSISQCNICDDTLRLLADGESSTTGNWRDCMALQLDADTVTSSDHNDCMTKTSLIVKPSISNDGHFCTCYQNDDSNEYYTIEYENDDELDTILPKVSHTIYAKYSDANKFIDDLIRHDNTRVDHDYKSLADKPPQTGYDINKVGEGNRDTVDDNAAAAAAKRRRLYERNSGIIDDDSDNENSEECNNNKIYLSNDDFKYGTYRIEECGEYILTEDILLHFNKPSDELLNDIDWSPNDYTYDNLPWYPTNEQQIEKNIDGTGLYVGPNAMRGTYQAGFHAGITIETGDVTVNLNGFTIEMDYIYYFQQRFFTIISLGNRPFIEDQGPANFGRQAASEDLNNILIKDGTLGLSSHHGIHGNSANNFVISNVAIKYFDVGGLQCNGCHYGTIENVVIGPQNDEIPVLGKYTHGRALLPRLNYLVDNYGDDSVVFPGAYNNEAITMKELADNFVEQMDLIYNHFIHNIDYENDDTIDSNTKETWLKAKDLFYNPYGYSDGGSAYGILLNGLGTAVTSFGRRMNDKGSNIAINNVEVFGIRNQPWEKFWARYKKGRQLQGFFFDTLDWEVILDTETREYIAGNAYWDLVFATQYSAPNDEFCLYNTMFVNEIADWVFEQNTNAMDHMMWQCGSDVQSHDAKGTMAIRIDSVTDVSLNNLYIHDIANYGELGNEEFCGDYDVIEFLSQTFPKVEQGYTGTRAHGIATAFSTFTQIDNIIIESVHSKYGTSIGASLWEGTQIDTMSNVNVNNINGGFGFRQENTDDDDNNDQNKFDGLVRSKDEILAMGAPNYTPRACGVEVGEEEDKYPIVFNHDNIDYNSIISTKVNGYEQCNANARIGLVSNGESKDDNNFNTQFQQNKDNIIKNMNKRSESLNKKTGVNLDKPFTNMYVIVSIVTIICMTIAAIVWLIVKANKGDYQYIKDEREQYFNHYDYNTAHPYIQL